MHMGVGGRAGGQMLVSVLAEQGNNKSGGQKLLTLAAAIRNAKSEQVIILVCMRCF